MAVKYLVFVF